MPPACKHARRTPRLPDTSPAIVPRRNAFDLAARSVPTASSEPRRSAVVPWCAEMRGWKEVKKCVLPRRRLRSRDRAVRAPAPSHRARVLCLARFCSCSRSGAPVMKLVLVLHEMLRYVHSPPSSPRLMSIDFADGEETRALGGSGCQAFGPQQRASLPAVAKTLTDFFKGRIMLRGYPADHARPKCRSQWFSLAATPHAMSNCRRR